MTIRDLDDFEGFTHVRCLHCGTFEAWTDAEKIFASGWRLTKHFTVNWLCPQDAVEGFYCQVVAPPDYWKLSQVGPNATVPS